MHGHEHVTGAYTLTACGHETAAVGPGRSYSVCQVLGEKTLPKAKVLLTLNPNP